MGALLAHQSDHVSEFKVLSVTPSTLSLKVDSNQKILQSNQVYC